ncbi:MAG: UDP-N-acetylmuramoyl-L-alanyl-D-glutamate--2,6-diaminopimelate ligase [Candidatus Gallionella acididurans]|uniref:UDP-N-acetylmuramoyl-L-alanyl-D-glutamate--2,6-diaminopimelate ligase n=1 Tax=Candidatus Gallionella acididurans TaxID=1796491 RepID=A0A139BWM1_9PROT|nr:MAG: UDP-N-acetylmuramoyl-L-alanyl-D-glutamate--2,6-diaminopimelate ligase [Candidatus Gallionella acididurans]
MNPAPAPGTGFPFQKLAGLNVTISRMVTDSREVRRGDTFIAYPGEKSDGRQFIAEAIARGANAVIWEERNFSWIEGWQVPNLGVADLRRKAGWLADVVYGAPSEKLWVVGVTGTNGKTSTSHWIARALSDLAKKCALIGTLGNGFPGDIGRADALQATANTTPDAVRVHGLLAGYLRDGAQAVAMEVSSHALSQERVNGVRFDVAMFTNLSRDHLDYHGDMQSYAAAKRRLFDWQSLEYVVLNLDDAYGAELAEQLSLQEGRRGVPGGFAGTLPQQGAGVEVVGYGLSDTALQLAERLGLRMVYGNLLEMNGQGLRIAVHSSWGAAQLECALVGRFNAANLLGTLAVLLVSDIALNDAVHSLGKVQSVPGRMQRLGSVYQPTVIIDYAHTPDALEKVLQALREVNLATGGKLICVFGCGGDRDRGKRAMMGIVAEKYANHCIVTSDNPRSEDPHDIIAEIVSGMNGNNHQIMADRAAAIHSAIAHVGQGDTVLIAGKGHEDYQEISGVKYPFSDVLVAQQALNASHGGVRT